MYSLIRIIYNYFNAHCAACSLALKNLLCTPVRSGLTLLAISLSLTLPILSLITLENISSLTSHWDKGTNLSLYLQKNVSSSEAQGLLTHLLSNKAIQSGSYLAPDEALREFKTWSHLDEALDLLPDNPLPGVITLSPRNGYDSPKALLQLSEELKKLKQVEHLSFDYENATKLNTIMDFAQIVFFIFIALISIGNSLIIANTIQLALETHKEECKTLSFLGASFAFIRRPFLYRGLWYGLLGAILSYLFVIIALDPLKVPLAKVAALYGEHFRLQSGDINTFLSILIMSTTLGYIGAWIAWLLYNKK